MELKHKLALLDNAVDSLNEALDKYKLGAHEGKSEQLKFAVLHMAHFVELLLKKRLSDIHPLLIYERPFEAKLRTNRTVSVSKAINFLRHADELEDEFHDDLKWLTELRNRITHHEFEIDIPRTKDILGRIVRATYDFCDENSIAELENLLDTDSSSTLKSLLDDYTEKLKLAKSNADEHAQLFGPFDDAHSQPEGPFECGDCGEVDCVAAIDEQSETGFPCKCFACESEGQLARCEECGTWSPDWDLVTHPYTDQQTVCWACQESLIHKYDDD